MNIDKVLGRSVLVVAVGCVALVAVTVVALAEPSVRAHLGFGRVTETSYEVGQRIELPPAVYAATPRTLVLFASSRCAVCLRTAPFFRTLASQVAGRDGLQMQVVMDAASDADRAEALAYASSIGLDASAVVVRDLRTTRIKRVPTLILVDGNGTVLSDWESPMPQDEVFRTLVSMPSAR